MLDVSQVTRLYAADKSVRRASLHSLKLTELGAPLPAALSTRLPGQVSK